MSSSYLIKFRRLPLEGIFLLSQQAERLAYTLGGEAYRKTTEDWFAPFNAVPTHGGKNIYVQDKTIVLWISNELDFEAMKKIAENRFSHNWAKEGF